MSSFYGNGGGGSSSAAIETNIQNPTDGQTLKYDAASGKWVNGEGGAGGSTLVVTSTYDESSNVNTLDKTWQEIRNAMPNVMLVDQEDRYLITSVYYLEELTKPYMIDITNGSTQYYASTPSDYPSTDNGSGGGIG